MNTAQKIFAYYNTPGRPTIEQFQRGNFHVIRGMERLGANVPSVKAETDTIVANLRICEVDYLQGRDITMAYSILLRMGEILSEKHIVGYKDFESELWK